MRDGLFALVLLGFAVFCGDARAGSVRAEIRDDKGNIVADAVVYLTPANRELAIGGNPKATQPQLINQDDETFLPLVTAVGKGGAVVFQNSDETRHHAYSFSSAKRFENLLRPGELSEPIELETPGMIAVGCNIHDSMVAHIFVADTPWFAISDNNGVAEISDVPPGEYIAAVWHPSMKRRGGKDKISVSVGASLQAISFEIKLRRSPRPSNRHKSDY